VKNPNGMIEGLMKQIGARDELLKQQEKLLIQEKQISEELKKLLALENGKVEKFDQEAPSTSKTLTRNKASTS
jgi:hypothetical protein